LTNRRLDTPDTPLLAWGVLFIDQGSRISI